MDLLGLSWEETLRFVFCCFFVFVFCVYVSSLFASFCFSFASAFSSSFASSFVSSFVSPISFSSSSSGPKLLNLYFKTVKPCLVFVALCCALWKDI